ncbi:CARDB domain-containing protein [Longimicrobium sp.]|uniref:CARDB domain-containing protein n=1 Tax=Longimicrobium sp. TaxID=2029185 RepID=UPI002C7FAF90|nr:CARDB domain-containing protein [Longimicrobium sp.]HSU14109.1 CARDB domain-containing protein [Longimicrobium sp.]
MKRFLATVAAALSLAGCGGDGNNPVSAEGSRPALTGTGLPNLYISEILPRRDANGVLTARIRVCNNGTTGAAASTTYLEHWYDLSYDIHDIYTTNLAAGWCTYVTSAPLGDNNGAIHSYYAKADEFLVIQESNENDNEKEIDVYP